MRRTQLAPRLKLLGLLLITASIIMGLLLSAAGVQTVNLKAPFAQKVAKRLEELPRLDNANGVRFDNGSIGTDSFQAWPNPASPASTVLPPNGFLDAAAGQTSDFSGMATDSEIPNEQSTSEPMEVPLWGLIAPMLIAGVLLWMTPQPSMGNAAARARRR